MADRNQVILLELLKKQKEEKDMRTASGLIDNLTKKVKMIGGAKGDKGDKGEQGIQGIKGDKGDKGADGKDGKNGLNGKDGTNGKDGKDGYNGIDGKNGIDGLRGKDGKDGVDGSLDTNGVEKLRNGLLEVMNKNLMSLDNHKALGIKADGQLIGQANEINFIGATIRNNSNQGVDVTISGGGGGTIIPGTTPISPSIDKAVLFDNAGVVGESSDLTFDNTTFVNISKLTISNSNIYAQLLLASPFGNMLMETAGDTYFTLSNASSNFIFRPDNGVEMFRVRTGAAGGGAKVTGTLSIVDGTQGIGKVFTDTTGSGDGAWSLISGSSITLPQYQVPFGSSSNTMTSNGNLTYVEDGAGNYTFQVATGVYLGLNSSNNSFIRGVNDFRVGNSSTSGGNTVYKSSGVSDFNFGTTLRFQTDATKATVTGNFSVIGTASGFARLDFDDTAERLRLTSNNGVPMFQIVSGSFSTSMVHVNNGFNISTTDSAGLGRIHFNPEGVEAVEISTFGLQVQPTFSANIGNASRTNQKVLRVGSGTSFIDFGDIPGAPLGPSAAIWFNQATPSATNYGIVSDGADILLNATNSAQIRVSNSNILNVNATGATVNGNFSSIGANFARIDFVDATESFKITSTNGNPSIQLVATGLSTTKIENITTGMFMTVTDAGNLGRMHFRPEGVETMLIDTSQVLVATTKILAIGSNTSWVADETKMSIGAGLVGGYNSPYANGYNSRGGGLMFMGETGSGTAFAQMAMRALGGSSSLKQQGSMTNYGYLFVGNYSGTSIPMATTTQLDSSRTVTYDPSATGEMIISGDVIYNLIGTTSTNIGTRLDSVGFRIGQISTLHNSNTVVFEVGGNTLINGSITSSTLTSGFFPVASTGGLLIDSAFSTTNLVSSTFTPSATNVTNITTSTPNNATYQRIGNIVNVFGSITVTNTLAVASEVDISLPIASNLGAATDLNGTATMDSTASVNIYINGDATNNRARIFFTSAGVGQTSVIYYSFEYEVI